MRLAVGPYRGVPELTPADSPTARRAVARSCEPRWPGWGHRGPADPVGDFEVAPTHETELFAVSREVVVETLGVAGESRSQKKTTLTRSSDAESLPPLASTYQGALNRMLEQTVGRCATLAARYTCMDSGHCPATSMGGLTVAGLELVVGYLIAWVVRKARRVGDRLEDETDKVLDAGLDRLHGLIAQKLGDDTALRQLEVEAEDNQEVPPRTRKRAQLALEDAADRDHEFADQLEAALRELESSAVQATAKTDSHEIVADTVEINAQSGGVASGLIHGSVSVSNPTLPDPAAP